LHSSPGADAAGGEEGVEPMRTKADRGSILAHILRTSFMDDPFVKSTNMVHNFLSPESILGDNGKLGHSILAQQTQQQITHSN